MRSRSPGHVLGVIALQVVTLLAMSQLGSSFANAADVPCGTATAYTAPTATTAGSVGIGTSTFVLAAGATAVGAPPGTTPPQAPIGFGTCINGPRNSSGAFTAYSFSPINAGICGSVSGYQAASPTAKGTITLTNGSTAPSTLPIATGVALTTAQVTGNQCFNLSVDAQGTGQVSGYAGPQSGSSPPAATAPSTSAAAPSALASASSQPQSGGTDFSLLWLLVGLAVVGFLVFLFARARRTKTP